MKNKYLTLLFCSVVIALVTSCDPPTVIKVSIYDDGHVDSTGTTGESIVAVQPTEVGPGGTLVDPADANIGLFLDCPPGIPDCELNFVQYNSAQAPTDSTQTGGEKIGSVRVNRNNLESGRVVFKFEHIGQQIKKR